MASRGNSLIEQRIKKKQEEEYQKRLKNVKGQLDLTPPRNSLNLQIQLNKLHMEQERQAAIDKQNLIIIEKLTEIKNSPGRIDNTNKTWKPSNDRLKRFRERRQRRIEQENRVLAERLKKVQSYYDAGEWERDYKKHLYYMSMRENTTKDYDYVEYEDDKQDNSSDRSSGEDDTESLPPVPPATPERDKRKEKKDSDEEDNISLPPINEKQGKKDANKNEDGKKDEGYSEQDATMDAEQLRAAIKDENKDKILDILGRTSEREKLQQLRDKYKEMYDKDLIEDVKSSLDEEAQSVLQSLSSSAAEEDVKRLNEAIKGLGTDEDTIIEILCTRNNKELEAIRDEYYRKFDRSLEEDLKGDTSGDVEKILVELSKGQREETDEVDKGLAKRDAEDLIEAGIGSWGTDEAEFIRIFTQRSLPQLAAMYHEYNKLAKMDIEESIDKEMDGDLQKTFLALVKHSRNPSGMRENKLNNALKDGDTETVARIILPLNKGQLSKLCSSYKKSNKSELADDIEKKCSGDLKQMLLAKLGKDADSKKKEKEKTKKETKAKSKESDKLPVIGKKKEQEKKAAEKKQGKKSEAANKEEKEQDTSEKDAQELHQAIQDKNKNKIIDVLSKSCSDNKKLEKLRNKYQERHEEGLLDALKSVVDDEDLQDPLECLFTPVQEYEAKSLYEATKGIGTDEDLLIEILCTRSQTELSAIQESYRTKYGTSLESDIKSDTSGDFQDLLLELLKGGRDESDKVDKPQAKKDAEALFQAGEKRFGTDEKIFINILTQRNPGQLNAIFLEYKKLAKVEIEESIEKEMTGDFEKGLLVLVKCMRHPSQFYSNKLHSSLQDGDTSTAARLILTNDKAKLAETMNEYKKANNISLEADVAKTCSENLKKLLLAKMGKGKSNQQQQRGNQGKGKDTTKDKRNSSTKTSPAKKQTETTKAKKEDETSQLYKAIQAEDKKKVKEIVVRNATEKAKLKKLSDDYKKEHSQHLLEALESNIEEDLLEAITALLLPPSQADARTLYYAMKGIGTNEAILIEILCSRNNAEILNIKKEYKKKYGKSLEDEVKSETSGDFEKLLVSLLQGQRDESKSVSDDQAHKDAETLIEAGIKTWGTDEDKFIEIFTTRSIPQLQAMLPEYNKWAKCDIEESIESEMDGDLQNGLLTLVACVRDPVKSHVDKLHTALQDGDTTSVARIIAGSNEPSLKELESTYNTNYKPKLYNEVDKKCSPELKKILLPKLKDKNQEKTSNKTKAEPKKQTAAATNKKENKTDEITQLHHAIEEKDKKKIKDIVLKNATDKNKLKKLHDDYQQRYKKDLVDLLDSKIEDDLHEAITALLLPPCQADARTLFYAMKGIGTKESLLIEILCTRNNEEIREIKAEYRRKYGRSLEEDVKGDTTDDFEKLLSNLLKATRDETTEIDEELVSKEARALYEAGVKKWGTDEDKFIEILATRNIAHLQAMMDEYTKLSGVELEESIKDEMDGDLQDGLIMLLSFVQDESKAMADNLHTALHDHDTSSIARIIVNTEQDKMTEIETAYNLYHIPKIYFEVNNKCSEDLKKIILPKLKDKKQEKEKQTQKIGTKKQNTVVKNDKNTKQPSKNPAAATASNDKEEDCSLLYRAIKNKDKKTITEIVVQNAVDKNKMKKLSEDYIKRYKKDLVEELDSKMEDDIHEAITALLLPPSQADARTLYYAMKGIGANETHLIEILCTKSNEEMMEIKKEYQKKYGRSLAEDIKYQTSGYFENLLTALMKGNRDESSKVNEEDVLKDATALYEAGVKKWGTDEDKFIEILATRNIAHLQAMMDEYTKLSGVELEESIKDEMDGDLQDGLIMLLSFVQDESKAVADKLNTCLQEHDTSSIARIIVSTEQEALSAIETSYNSTYKALSLYSEVDKKCSDDLKKIILPKLKDDKAQNSATNDKQAKKTARNSHGRNSVRSNSKQSTDDGTKTRDEKIEEDDKKEVETKPEDDKNEERPKLNIKEMEYHGTVVAAKNFDAARDAERLKKAMKGFGSDEDMIISVLTSCNSSQRQEIAASFKEEYGKDLVDELKSELSGKFKEAIVGLMSSPALYDANVLNSAMKGLGTQDRVLTEIICSRSSKEIEEVKEAYKTVYGKDLIEEVKNETSGDFRSILVALLQGKRASSDSVHEDDAYKDAERLLEEGEKRWGTDESVFIDILTTRNPMQLKAIFQAYKQISNKEILDSIDEELEGDFHDAVKTIVLCTCDPPKCFVESLHSAMNGIMTDSTTIIRIIITRSEIDLLEIKSTYVEQFEKALDTEVKDKLQGDQELLLLKLLGD